MTLLCLLAAAVVAADPAYTVFPRNQSDAALRLPVEADAAAVGRLTGSVGDIPLDVGETTLRSGKGVLVLPFDAGRFRPGDYGWRVALTGSDGARLVARSGRLTILPRRERGAFKMMSWGGWTNLPPDYLLRHGLNAVNLQVGHGSVAAYLEAGLFVNLRLENAKSPEATAFDLVGVANAARERLSPYRGLHLWTTTLVNSEVYDGAWMTRMKACAAWTALAERELGFPPAFEVKNPPLELDYAAMGVAPFKGVIPNCRAFASAAWFRDCGQHLYRVNAACRDVVHEISPGNLVWSEPAYGGLFSFMDMGATWIYDYPTDLCLGNLRALGGAVRACGRRALPTLADGYWHRQIPRGRHPTATDGKTGEPLKVRLGQTADELMVKSWLAVASIPADGLSFFSADTWMLGETNAVRCAADPAFPAKIIAEPGSTDRYGRFVRRTFLTAAELLRNMTNAAPALAFVMPSEVDLAGGFRWLPHNYRVWWRTVLGGLPVACDFLSDAELTPAALSRYRYVIVPMLSVVTREHDAALRAAAVKGTTLVVDDFCATDYPGMVRLPMAFSPHPKKAEAYRRVFLDWFEGKRDELRAAAGAKSDEDGADVFTFEKVDRGARYVTVVNATRGDRQSILNAFCTNAWYRPHGAARRITTRIRLPRGAAVYDVTGGGGRLTPRAERGEAALTFDYEAAEGKLFAVYPRPLARLEVAVEGEARPGGRLVLRTKVFDSAGAPAPGRQMVALKLYGADGRPRDESGRYVAEGGEAAIRVRLADDEPDGRWTAVVKDLTSGLRSETAFEVKKKGLKTK